MAFELLKCGLPFDIVNHIKNISNSTDHLSCVKCKMCVVSLSTVSLFSSQSNTYWWIKNCMLCTNNGFAMMINSPPSENGDIYATIDHTDGFLSSDCRLVYHNSLNMFFENEYQYYEMKMPYFVFDDTSYCIFCGGQRKKLKLAFEKFRKRLC